MDINTAYDISYISDDSTQKIRVLSDTKKLAAVWEDNNKLELFIKYDISEKRIDKFEGELSNYINKPELSTEEKIERVLEALNNGLWSHFHPEVKSNKVKM